MMKRIAAMGMLLVLLFAVSAQGAEVRAIRANPSLTFDGTTANCFVDCKSGNSNDKIKATLTLYQGSTYVDSWSESGNGRVIISETCRAKSGKAYKLKLSYSVNGEAMDSITVTNTCP